MNELDWAVVAVGMAWLVTWLTAPLRRHWDKERKVEDVTLTPPAIGRLPEGR